jgi:hypothetical protein
VKCASVSRWACRGAGQKEVSCAGLRGPARAARAAPRPGWAPDPLMVGIRSPDGLVVGLAPATLEFWVRFPNERNQGKQAHPVLKYRVPQGSHSTCPPLSSSPHAHSFVIGPAVIKHTRWEGLAAHPPSAARGLLYGSLRMAADSWGVMGMFWGLSACVHVSRSRRSSMSGGAAGGVSHGRVHVVGNVPARHRGR